MTLEAAPYHVDIAENPDCICHWVTTVDGIRTRIGHWPADNTKGTVLIFPGRTEYVEKYGRSAKDLAARGYCSVTIDWRGQGIADRLLENRAIGHVDVFEDYQLDVKAMLSHVEELKLPKPYFLLAHSMGGCIGLRSLYDGLPVKCAAFSAPMWGIRMSPALRPIAWGLSSVSKPLGFSGAFAPGQVAETYVLRASPEDNTLTSDASAFEMLQTQLKAHPDLALGGPSLHWLNEALREMRTLAQRASPDLPCVTFLGSEEAIVDPTRIHERMDSWSNGELMVLDMGRHEVLMELPKIRDKVLDGATALFDAQLQDAA